MNRSVSEHYSSEYANIRQFPFILSNAVPKSRLVMTGSLDGPWGTIIAGKLTLATPTPIAYDANVKSNGDTSWWKPVSLTPTGGIGYKDLDLQLTKNFDMGGGRTFYLRADWLNVFNTFNPDPYNNGYNIDYGDYSTFDASNVKRPTPNRLGNILGTPSTLKLSVGFRF
jgi:hypothetical protein